MEHTLSELKLKHTRAELAEASGGVGEAAGSVGKTARHETGPSPLLFAGIELKDMQ